MALSNAVQSGTTEPIDRDRGDSDAVSTVFVDLDAIAHNVRILRDHAGGAGVMVVVKADAYNHGAVEVARTALGAGARELGVTTVHEALVLRNAGITAPILAWLHHVDTDFAPAIVADVELGLSSTMQLEAVLTAARSVGRTATVTLKIDTGLNRNGIDPADLDDVIDVLRGAVADGTARLRGVFSHLACADVPDHPANDQQAESLRAAVARLRAANLHPEVTHLANSAATLTRPDLHFDLVRPGIAAYGLSPIPELGDFGLRPAMTVSTKVALVKKVRAGQGVSYGHTWSAPEDTVVALIPMGYADGVRRNLSGRFDVGIGGRRFPAVGRVCMDQFVVDLGPDGAGVAVGDTAVLFGSGENGEPVAQDWADTLDTIHYEVVTGIGGRIKREFGGVGAGNTAAGEVQA